MRCHAQCVQPTGTAAHCSVCHLTFGSVRYFDWHRHQGACRSPEDMGLSLTPKGVWRITGEKNEDIG